MELVPDWFKTGAICRANEQQISEGPGDIGEIGEQGADVVVDEIADERRKQEEHEQAQKDAQLEVDDEHRDLRNELHQDAHGCLQDKLRHHEGRPQPQGQQDRKSVV